VQQPFVPPSTSSLAEVGISNVVYRQETVTVEGVVSPSGQAGWAGDHPDHRIHSFTLAAWRFPGSDVTESELWILRAVPPDVDMAKDFREFPEYTIVRLEVLLAEDQESAVFYRALDRSADDDELLQVAERLKHPLTMSTEAFGEFVLDRRIGWFDGSAEWNGAQVELSLRPDIDDSLDPAIRAAEAIWASQADLNRQIEESLVSELLELKNDAWLLDDEAPLCAVELLERLELTSISVRGDGDFEFYYADDAMFAGHWVSVRGSLSEGPTEVGLAG
jgi:hypothetical protein